MTARTLSSADIVELLHELSAALEATGIPAEADGDTLTIDGTPFSPRLEQRAHPTPAALSALIATPPIQLPAMVIADRISTAGRDVLRDAGWGWLDRRGHMRIWTRGIRIESQVPGYDGDTHRVSNAWTTVGLEVALAALCEPTVPVAARRVAATIDRSTGSTHELIGRFIDNGLIGQRTHLPLLPDLFWETAARWPDDDWSPLPVTIDELASELEPDALFRVDERAATLGGARIPAVGDLPARCYIASPRLLRKARSLADRAEPTRSYVREPPITWLPELTQADTDAELTKPWRVAHPLICALRLATDPSRGREIVESWGIVPEAPE